MPWRNTPTDRRQSDATYHDPVYQRNKAIVRRRSGGRCEWAGDGRRCGSRDRVQCDHKTPISQGGTHALANLWDLCRAHHNAKTAAEGNAGRHGGARVKDPPVEQRTAW